MNFQSADSSTREVLRGPATAKFTSEAATQARRIKRRVDGFFPNVQSGLDSDIRDWLEGTNPGAPERAIVTRALSALALDADSWVEEIDAWTPGSDR